MDEKKTKNGEMNSRVRNNWLLPKKKVLVRSIISIIYYNAWCHDAFRIEIGKETSTKYILRRRFVTIFELSSQTIWRMTNDNFWKGFPTLRYNFTIFHFSFISFHFIQFNFRNLNALNLIFYVSYECCVCWHAMKFTASISSLRMYDLHELHTPQWVWNGMKWNVMKWGPQMLYVERRFHSVNIMANDDLHSRIQ